MATAATADRDNPRRQLDDLIAEYYDVTLGDTTGIVTITLASIGSVKYVLGSGTWVQSGSTVTVSNLVTTAGLRYSFVVAGN